jgi:hypothetical protein
LGHNPPPALQQRSQEVGPQAECNPLPSRTSGWKQPMMGACHCAEKAIVSNSWPLEKTMAIAPHEFIRGS